MFEETDFTAAASFDLHLGFFYYESRETGLGQDFVEEVRACLGTIREQPRMFPIARGDYRRARIRRFPYELF